MKATIKDYFSAEFIKFVTVSTFAAGVNFITRIVVDVYTNYLIAIIIAFCFGLVTAFGLNKLFVFKDGKQSVKQEFSRFTIVNLLGLVQTIVFSYLFRNLIFPAVGIEWFVDEISHLIGLGIPMITNFIAHKYFSFKK